MNQFPTVGIDIGAMADRIGARPPTTAGAEQFGTSPGMAVLVIRKISADLTGRVSAKAGVVSRLIRARPFTAVVGFLTLYHPDVRNLLDRTIYLDAPEDVLVSRRVARADPENPWDRREYINEKLLPGHSRVVQPQREFAKAGSFFRRRRQQRCHMREASPASVVAVSSTYGLWVTSSLSEFR